jgi:hypothetical protein
MSRRALCIAAVAAFVLSSCATSYRPDAGHGGYAEAALAADSYRVEFQQRATPPRGSRATSCVVARLALFLGPTAFVGQRAGKAQQEITSPSLQRVSAPRPPRQCAGASLNPGGMTIPTTAIRVGGDRLHPPVRGTPLRKAGARRSAALAEVRAQWASGRAPRRGRTAPVRAEEADRLADQRTKRTSGSRRRGAQARVGLRRQVSAGRRRAGRSRSPEAGAWLVTVSGRPALRGVLHRPARCPGRGTSP